MTQGTKLRAAIYTRISKLTETNDDSTQRQETRCREFCRSQGWQVVGAFTDEGISGYKDVERPGWSALEQAVSTGAVDVVVVFAISRAGRTVGRLVRFMDLCRERGIRFASVSEGIDSGTAMGEVMFSVIAALAQLESRTKAERLLSKNEARAAEGAFHGGQPAYGYGRIDGKTVVIKEEALVLQEAAQRVINGESLRSIERDLNRRGIPAKKGGPWAGQLRQCLAQPFIVGRRMHNGQDVAAAQWPAIIDPATWQKVQDIFSSNRQKRASRGSARTYLLTGLLTCGNCGSGLSGGGSGDYRKYGCRNCHSLTVRARDLEEEVTHQAAYRNPPATHVVKDPNELATEYLSTRHDLEGRKRQAEDAYAAGELPIDALTAVSAKISREMDDLDARYGAEADRAVPVLPDDPRGRLEVLIESIEVARITPAQNRAPVANRLTIRWRDGVTLIAEPPERPRASKQERPPCSVEKDGVKCERPSVVLGVRQVAGQRGITDRPLCGMHYRRLQDYGDVGPVTPKIRLGGKKLTHPCSVPTCPFEAHSRGWCSGHYTRWNRTGDVQAHVPLAGSGVTKQDSRPRKNRAA